MAYAHYTSKLLGALLFVFVFLSFFELLILVFAAKAIMCLSYEEGKPVHLNLPVFVFMCTVKN